MESMDNIRERCEALAQRKEQWQRHARTVERRLRWGRGTWSIAAVIALGLALGSPHQGQAKTFQCGAGDVLCLIDAINDANANGQANTIRLETGTYTLTMVDNNSDGPNGLPSITSPLTLRGADPDTTIIERAAPAPDFRLVHVAASGTLTLAGLTLQGGSCRDCGSGGLRNDGTLTLRHSVVRSNFSAAFGFGAGGLENRGTATLTHCTFVSNSGRNASGGIWNSGTMTIHRCTIANNRPVQGDAGGIWNGGQLLLTDSTLSGNWADFGSGILTRGTLVVINSTITGNMATAVLSAPALLNGGRPAVTRSLQQYGGG